VFGCCAAVVALVGGLCLDVRLSHMIHALPGMGADHRMFPGPWNDLPGFVAHNWPRHIQERTLPEVARRVCEELDIRDGDILVGASLGGMVACEVAKVRKIKALYLVGSATSKDEVSRLLAVLHPLIDLAPVEWIRVCAGKIPRDLPQMFEGVEATFLRSMCSAIFQWKGCGSLPVRCFRIHGRRDFVIPAPALVDLLLDGGHLISMTHAKECAEFLRAMNASQPIRSEASPTS
jgi:pimeloyl-ACP methyl ester carboxylesterase